MQNTEISENRSVILPLGIYPNEMNSAYERVLCLHGYSGATHSSYEMESTDNWMKKMWYFHNGILFSR